MTAQDDPTISRSHLVAETSVLAGLENCIRGGYHSLRSTRGQTNNANRLAAVNGQREDVVCIQLCFRVIMLVIRILTSGRNISAKISSKSSTLFPVHVFRLIHCITLLLQC